MQCLYLDTVIIGHKVCNKINKVTFQKELHNLMTNIFYQRGKPQQPQQQQQQQNKKDNIKVIVRPRSQNRDPWHCSLMRYA